MTPILGLGEVLWDFGPHHQRTLGGAPLNFVYHCQALGEPGSILSAIGNDEGGREALAEFQMLKLDVSGLIIDPVHPTGSNRMTIDGDISSFNIARYVAWDYLKVDSNYEAMVHRAKAICFGTLAQRSPQSEQTIQHYLNIAAGLVIFDVNLRGPVMADMLRNSLAKSHWVKLNEEEAERLSQILGEPFEQMMQQHASQTAQSRWIITRGAKGCTVFEHRKRYDTPGVVAKVVDTVGAGDAFTAAMVCKHFEGVAIPIAMEFAVRYAAKVCEHAGAIPPIGIQRTT